MKKQNKIYWIVGVVVVILIIILSFITNRKESSSEVVKIGVLGDLTGDLSSLFRGVPRGVDMAKLDIEKEKDVKLQIFLEDQESCNPQNTISLMNKFINIDKVDFVVGGSCSGTTLVAAPLANEGKLPIISPVSSAPNITEAGGYVFRTYISDSERTEKSAELAYSLGFRRMAVLKDISAETEVSSSSGGRKRFEELGGVVVSDESLTINDKDFKTQLSKIKLSKPDVLFLCVISPGQISIITKQMKELGLDIQIIMPNEIAQNNELLVEAKEYVDGLIYTLPGDAPLSDKLIQLKDYYKLIYNEEAIPIYTLEAYDAVWLGTLAVLKSDRTKESIKDSLYQVSQDYKGVSGDVEFDENGDVHKSVVFYQIKDGKFIRY
jgi:branched-chain amino acid transport system substrate-binding protein